MSAIVDVISIKLSGETVKRVMIIAGIDNVHETCSNCDHPVRFTRIGTNIRRDTKCHYDPQGYVAKTWDSVAACLNKQTNVRIKQNLMWELGLTPEEFLP